MKPLFLSLDQPPESSVSLPVVLPSRQLRTRTSSIASLARVGASRHRLRTADIDAPFLPVPGNMGGVLLLTDDAVARTAAERGSSDRSYTSVVPLGDVSVGRQPRVGRLFRLGALARGLKRRMIAG